MALSGVATTVVTPWFS